MLGLGQLLALPENTLSSVSESNLTTEIQLSAPARSRLGSGF